MAYVANNMTSRGAELILVNGNVVTLEERRPRAKGIAIGNGRVLAVGSNEQAERWGDRRSRIVDLRGRTVLPGFCDSHTHVASASAKLDWIRLDEARSLSEALSMVRNAIEKASPGSWVVGQGWDESKWLERQPFNRVIIDAVAPRNPVLLARVDWHSVAVNSRALERLKIAPDTGGVVRDENGEPTGILKEEAAAAMLDLLKPTVDQIASSLAKIARFCHSLGITSIHDIVHKDEIVAYQRLRDIGQLKLRVYLMPRASLLDAISSSGLRTRFGGQYLQLGAIKVFADGSLGSRTAALSRPFSDDISLGQLMYANEEMHDIFLKAHRSGLQLAVHAIGDRAIEQVISIFEKVQEDQDAPSPRHRIEHLELPTEAHLERMREAGLIASMQPNFIGRWSGPGEVYEQRLGRERTTTNNPLRWVRKHRVKLCFGSDGMPYGPLYGIHYAVNGFFACQRIGVEQAIRAYASGGAFASFQEDLKGGLAEGKLADLVVLDRDPTKHPESIKDVKILATVVGGKVVYGRLL